MQSSQYIKEQKSTLQIIVMLALILLLVITLAAVLASYFWSVTQT